MSGGRKVIQIAATVVSETEYMKYAYVLTALCGDGTMWESVNGEAWKKLDGVPQHEQSAVPS